MLSEEKFVISGFDSDSEFYEIFILLVYFVYFEKETEAKFPECTDVLMFTYFI